MGNRQQTASRAKSPMTDVASANTRAASIRAHRLAEIERLSRIDPVAWLAQHAPIVPELTEDAGVYRMRRQAPVDKHILLFCCLTSAISFDSSKSYNETNDVTRSPNART